ncbi:MAG: hypothetical protein K8I00_11975, partial [Candidatus Omnitrophica bacterium]|nr:hypothetical protein [Candidatus Omnitrophota bacterium]
ASLYQQSNNKDLHAYRFLWLRSFHDPICLRLTINNNGTGILTVKSTDGAGGYDAGKLVNDYEVLMTVEQVSTFVEKIRQAKFWKMPERKMIIGLDGARWILEGLKEGRYHIVDRWSPDGGKFREAVEYLLQFSRLDIEPIY